mmetsp:Transcript_32775/g.39664  ORF Transcript_32775/g.39664 Transcript_32775/m.39664 type:complete len:168 (+) Transcript_32775:50-553(+)|eukprot:CAMPEP_0197846636 /NCGR_PEP_ID=MMETSP1438-20131217/3902_1 /TAXON_ID=1461541 /ORGANISM="Pterosperma sp., Strain CCMP1384" /LENGTH=167 /DNA_ID=CAMNT_0043458355 /DNA_START=44 /DNA_END=547 /DNA_ORIENTATION=+
MGNQRARSRGLRHGTRNKLSRPFRGKGVIPMSTYLRCFKVGDYVDVKINSAVHKGMPYFQYHGQTGVIWDVTPHAVGIELNKPLGNRIIKKRLHVRIEHVQQSRCREEFLNRRASNDAKKAEAKAKGEKVDCKRQPQGPKPAEVIKNPVMETITAIPYDIVKEGILG